MAVSFQCGQCGKNIRVPDAMAGKKGKCPSCGATLTVPFPDLVSDADGDADIYDIHEEFEIVSPAPSPAEHAADQTLQTHRKSAAEKRNVDSPRLNRWLLYILILAVAFLAAAWLMELFGAVAKIAIPQLAFSVGVPVAAVLSVLLLTRGRLIAFCRAGTARILFLIILVLWLGVMIYSTVQVSQTQNMTFSRLLLRRGPGYQKGVLRLAILERALPKVEQNVPVSFWDKMVTFDEFERGEDGRTVFKGDLGTYPVHGFGVFDPDDQLLSGSVVLENIPVYEQSGKGGARVVKRTFTIALTEAGLPKELKTARR